MHSPLRYSESAILSVTHVSGYTIVTFGSVYIVFRSCKNKGIFFITNKIKKTLTRRFGSDARGDRKLLYFSVWP